ncbi:MAG: hypothetical protein KBC53_07860 [Nitrosomonas sp.]|nr:hypothetical protein [Nitrosomonas sp.]
MDKPLTPKQEKFAQCVASGSTYSAAYRAAYNVGVNATSEGVNVSACKMMARANVRQRVEELRIPIEVQVGYTLKKYIEEMMELKKSALDAEELGAAIKSTELIGKCLGYYTQKTEITGKDGGPIEHKITRDIIDPVDGNDQY